MSSTFSTIPVFLILKASSEIDGMVTKELIHEEQESSFNLYCNLFK